MNSTRAPWFRVRPALRWTLGLSALAWLALLGDGVTREMVLASQLGSAARFAMRNAAVILNTLAVAAVMAAIVEAARTSPRWHSLMRKLARQTRGPLRQQPGAATGHA